MFVKICKVKLNAEFSSGHVSILINNPANGSIYLLTSSQERYFFYTLPRIKLILFFLNNHIEKNKY